MDSHYLSGEVLICANGCLDNGLVYYMHRDNLLTDYLDIQDSLRFRKLQRDLLLDDLFFSSNMLCFSTADQLYVCLTCDLSLISPPSIHS